ncbi:hypothetical protein AAMO2058_000599500 [Amorphochlora amoebiformis]
MGLATAILLALGLMNMNMHTATSGRTQGGLRHEGVSRVPSTPPSAPPRAPGLLPEQDRLILRPRKRRERGPFEWIKRMVGPTGYDQTAVAEALTREALVDLLNESERDEERLTVVMISMTYCGPCKMFEPKFKLFAEAYPDATFVKIVGDRNDETRAMLKSMDISAVPAFRIFKGNKDVSAELALMQQMGVIQAEKTLRAVLKRHYIGVS